jgi:parallel beta-helix repeat protein
MEFRNLQIKRRISMLLLGHRMRSVSYAAVFCGSLVLAMGLPAMANTLCVSSTGATGCYSTIGAAVAAASAGDTITIGIGQYNEGVVVPKPLALVGAGAGSTIINAKGQANGIYVDGLDNGGLSEVLVTGLTVVNANFEGILLTNVSNSLISNNEVANNDQSLNFTAQTCPGQPAFETSEGDDCGEGIHLMGTFNVTVADNDVDLNSGGILLSDETGTNYDNLITNNSVHDNSLDCGITLASHPPAPQTGAMLPYGVFSNNIVGNSVLRNGITGEGAGVGIYAPAPGNLNFSNRVIGNDIEDNGLPGVAMHNHAAPPGAPSINLNDNVIMGNYISGNGADVADTATSGPTGINLFSISPVYATEILQNTIVNEALDVVQNNSGGADVHLNDLLGTGVGVANPGKGSVNATLNYFGCSGGPGATGCTTISGTGVTTAPYRSTQTRSVSSTGSKP